MRKSATFALTMSVMLFCIAPAIAQARKLPPGTIQEGSLANQQLIRDTMLGVAGKAATLGCQSIDSYKPYVVAMPEGSPGSQVWREKWIVTCQGNHYSIDIRFNESGSGAADYQIQ
jgi:hypothetical protein